MPFVVRNVSASFFDRFCPFLSLSIEIEISRFSKKFFKKSRKHLKGETLKKRFIYNDNFGYKYVHNNSIFLQNFQEIFFINFLKIFDFWDCFANLKNAVGKLKFF